MDITNLLKLHFPEAEISFDGEDCNSKVLIVSRQFDGLSTIQRHKLVLSTLKDLYLISQI